MDELSDHNYKASPSQAHPDTMEFLSREWCNFAVQSLQPSPPPPPPHSHQHQQLQLHLYDHPIVPLHNPSAALQNNLSPVSRAQTEKSMKMDDPDFKSAIPPWKSNDVKSWIWMQQAMHPELNYNSFFSKKFKLSWNITPSIKKWWREIKAKRKEEQRLQRAEVQAAISVAGLAAALAAVAAENAENGEGGSTAGTKEAAVASAAAIVAARCAQVAEAMGANREQLSAVMGSSMTGTSVTDILTLTASANTSVRGAEALKARRECNMKKLDGVSTPVLPIQHSSHFPSELDDHISLLAKGTHLFVESPNGDFKVRTVSAILNTKGQVVLILKKLNLFKSKQECLVTNIHVELYKEAEKGKVEDTCYLIVMRTHRGRVKLDMGHDYLLYKTWVTTLNHMLSLSQP